MYGRACLDCRQLVLICWKCIHLEQGIYINVAAEIDALVLAVDDLENRPFDTDARLDAIEAKLAALDEQKSYEICGTRSS